MGRGLVAVIALHAVLHVSVATAAPGPVDPVTETWNAYVELRIDQGARSTYVFRSVGQLGLEFTENCLNNEIAVYANMASCAARLGDPVGKTCSSEASRLQKEFYSDLSKARRENAKALPNISINASCVASRVTYTFSEATAFEAATALVAGTLPKVGATASQETVLDGHFYNWSLTSCDPAKKTKLSRAACDPVMQTFKATGGAGPFLSKAQRNDLVAKSAVEAETARQLSVHASAPITGAFGLEFGKPATVKYQGAQVNAMVGLPGSPVFGSDRRGWAEFEPPERSAALADLTQVKFLALLDPNLHPIKISVRGRASGGCAALKEAIDQALGSKYGKAKEASTFTDGRNTIITQCSSVFEFAMSYIDVAGFDAHNQALQSEAAAKKRGLEEAVKRDL